MAKKEYLLSFSRISLGLIFIWGFLDKLFGLGFSTLRESSWISGTSPTLGFLKFASKGPFTKLFQAMIGNVFVDWIFMIGLLLVGFCLIFGIAKKISGYSGALMMFLMWLAVLPPEHHPFLDEHIIYIFILIFLAHTKTKFSLSNRWRNLKLVKKHPILE
ncbi:DoxX family membrane protein [Candidatus Pacearchaeota archaeon]|nr:DoxX family membrane protein [Candidatus Pacearchaeota archaeon]